jgi:hypothetical protein
MNPVAPVLAGTTLPHPAGFDFQRGSRGGRIRLASGGTAVSLVATNKHTFTLRWLALDEAGYAAVQTACDAAQASGVSFKTPRNTTHTVIVPNEEALQVQVVRAASGLRYNVSLTLAEQ